MRECFEHRAKLVSSAGRALLNNNPRRSRAGHDGLKPDHLIEIDHVTFGYDTSRTILNDISLRFARGKVTSILGGSGCGKTTLLRLIGGSNRANAGEVRFDGEVVDSRDSERMFRMRRRMGMIGKKELLKAPILGYGMGFVNVIAIDRSNRERAVGSIDEATRRLRSGISFGVCPEGTRARPGEMLPFKKGAFHMASQAGVPIVPIALKNSDMLMGRGTGEAWPGTIEMIMMPPVPTAWVKSDDDLNKLVHDVQAMIMNELGIDKLSPRKRD